MLSHTQFVAVLLPPSISEKLLLSVINISGHILVILILFTQIRGPHSPNWMQYLTHNTHNIFESK